MTEIAKCRCGAEARLSPPWSGRIRAVCVNDECDIRERVVGFDGEEVSP